MFVSKSFFEVFKYLYKKDGIVGLYRGWTITVLRAMPVNGILFLAYEETAQFLKKLLF